MKHIIVKVEGREYHTVIEKGVQRFIADEISK